jgi:hypothetical protein
VDYKGETYLARDFLKTFEDFLELIGIDLDHLPEEEQRQRGIIGPNDPAILKTAEISHMTDEKKMREEAKITQNICCRCHVRVTVDRDKKPRNYSKEYLEKKKYISKLKEKGCECCGFYDATLLRYLEFDHLNPAEKIETISQMMIQPRYTLKQLIDECTKCRILCQSCHRIHTRYQKKQGIVN